MYDENPKKSELITGHSLLTPLACSTRLWCMLTLLNLIEQICWLCYNSRWARQQSGMGMATLQVHCHTEPVIGIITKPDTGTYQREEGGKNFVI